MKKTKLTFILLIAVILTAFMPSNVLALTGSGTEGTPYIISSVSDLEYVKTNLSAHYRLANNITLTSAWTPIGTQESPFTGSFDGDGYTVSGLTMSRSGDIVFAGLFGNSTGDIKDLSVKMSASGITVTASEYAYVGAVVGYSNGGNIENCHASGEINVTVTTSANAANAYAGMIAGRSSGQVKSSETYGTVTVAMSETAATGTAANDAQIYAGGIVGLSEAYLEDNKSGVAIVASSTAVSEFMAPKVYAGGIAGENKGDALKNRATGNINATATSSKLEAAVYAGGIVGKNSGNIEIAAADGNVSAKTTASAARTYAGGIAGYTSGKTSQTYATGSAIAETTSTTDVAYAGGLIGLSNGQVSASYAIGASSAVAPSSNGLAGGLVGFASTAVVNSYYANNQGYATFNGCGTAKSDEELKLVATYTGWDFENIWHISEAENNGYPYLIDVYDVFAVFEDVEYTYDGTEKTITATNIADGVTITYSNNKGTNAGVYNAVATLSADGYTTTQMKAKLTIKPIVLTITGLAVNDKEYDNTTTATIDASNAVISGVLPGDEVSIDAENSVANFVTENIGDSRQVIISEIKFKGADAANYTAGIYYAEANIYTGTYDHVVFEGSGTREDPYIIRDENELNAVKGHLNAHFKLANNIILSESWIPIGRLNAPFTGTFDGNNFTISGISVDESINYTYSGLFGYNTGTISNLNVLINDNISTTADNVYVGAIAGHNGGTITNCIVNGSINTSPVSTYVYAGGVVGANIGTISYCDSNVEIIAKGATVYAGGVAGENGGTIETTASTGSVTIRDSLFAYAGGFVGLNSFAIENSYSLGDVTINVSDVTFMANAGGFAGRAEGGTIANCYSTGKSDITITTGAYVLNSAVGGFTSFNESMLTECYYDATTSGKSDTGKGTPKTTAELKSDATITNWDKDIWAIEEFANDGYPYIMKNFQMTERVLLDYSDRTVSVSAYADVATATLIVASYSEGALVDIEFDENFSIDKGETKTHTLSNDFKEIVGGSVKVMLWKSFETASPLCTFKEVQIR